MNIDERNLLSFMSVDKHTGSLLPITGIPCDVPVPKKIISKRIPIVKLRVKITSFFKSFCKFFTLNIYSYTDFYHTYINSQNLLLNIFKS